MSTSQKVSQPLFWFDGEYTGLGDDDRVMEIAAIITDSELNEVDSLGPIVIHQPDSLLDNMDEWCTNTHGKSGLTQRVRESTITEEHAHEMLFDFLKKHCDRRVAVLAGNTVHADRVFIKKFFPKVDEYLHYRIVDVSTIKELSFRRFPTLPRFAKRLTHRALDDIVESIAELKYYYQHIFKDPASVKVSA
ncbi:hypothetical protein P9112_009315 [Eukaryota sp. TZLM1-RC]